MGVVRRARCPPGSVRGLVRGRAPPIASTGAGFFLSAAVNERDNQSICAFKTKNVSPKCVCVHTIKVIDSLKWPTNQRPPIKDNFFSTTTYQLICMKILRLVEENEVDFSKKVSTRSADYKSRYKLFKINSEIIHF